MDQHDAILIVDQYERFRIASERGQKIDSRREAQGLSILLRPLGRHNRLIALITEHDQEGTNAYREAGFETIAMNGNRPTEVRKIVTQMQSTLETAPPRHLIVMTTDAQFLPLCASALANPRIQLGLWAPIADVPPAFTEPEYNFRHLEELLPDSRVPSVVVYLDYENLHIGLIQEGWKWDPAALVTSVKSKLADLGTLTDIFAYADWDLLSQRSSRNLQRELTLLGLRTRYQVNIKGKNSADMEMADDIRTMLDSRTLNSPDVIVLGTRDRDFRRTLDNATARGKRAVLLTLHCGLSNELRAVAGSEVRYLDEMLELPERSNQVATACPDDAVTNLVLKTELWLRQQGQEWAYIDSLLASTVPGEADLLEKAVRAGVFTLCQHRVGSDTPTRAFMLTAQHKTVMAVRYMIDWLPAQVAYCLNVKRLPWVDTKYLFNGMRMNATCRQLNIGQNREDAQEWLNRLSIAGLIIRHTMPHPKTPTTIITTWWLPEHVNKTSNKTPEKAYESVEIQDSRFHLLKDAGPNKPRGSTKQAASPGRFLLAHREHATVANVATA